MKYLNKSDVISSIIEKMGLTKENTTLALSGFVDTVSDALAKKQGVRVRLIGFGSFKVNYYKARKGRNPQAGKSMIISVHNVPAI